MQNKTMPTKLQQLQWKGQGRPRKRWRDEVEEDLSIMGMKAGR
jgi:hypothetical protein